MKRIFPGLLTAVLLMTGSAVAQSTPDNSTPNTQRADDNHHDYGWVGLIGLAGLAGLAGRKRDHDRTVDTRTGTSR
jgi:hypothetical protein